MKMNNGLFLFVAIFLVFGVALWANPPGSGSHGNEAVAASSSGKSSEPAKNATTKPVEAAKSAPAEAAKADAPKAEVAKAAPVVAAVATFDAGVTAPNGEKDYLKGKYHPIHFKPAIETATNEQCLACHKEVLENSVRETSPAGVKAAQTVAWYQTLDTYKGEQDTFHRRHMVTPMAEELMDLKCTFCHRGNDPREEAVVPPVAPNTEAGFTLRKMVDPEQTCLLCHGRFPHENMEGLNGPWTEERANFETEDGVNGCLACHAKEGGFRSNRHQVSYLKAENIEQKAQDKGADTCYGCHGGRSWYRISYPYPRHSWEGMSDETPAWAQGRPTSSDPRWALPAK